MIVEQLPSRIVDRSHLTARELGWVLKLADDGLTQTEIAQRLNCSQATISRVLSDFDDTRTIARKRLHASADAIAERLTKTKHAPTMLEVLRDVGVTEKQAPSAGSKGGVTVLVGAGAGTVNIQLNASLSPAQDE